MDILRLSDILTENNLGKTFYFVGGLKFAHTIVKNKDYITYVSKRYTVAPLCVIKKHAEADVVLNDCTKILIKR